LTELFANASFHLIEVPLGCPETVAVPVNILCPLEPVTYPLSVNVAVVNVVPPSLEILAIMSVFKVGVAMFSWNTTILLSEGAELAVNAFDTTVVLVAVAGKSAKINVYPSPPA
jgi:hypothetical protein